MRLRLSGNVSPPLALSASQLTQFGRRCRVRFDGGLPMDCAYSAIHRHFDHKKVIFGLDFIRIEFVV